MRTLWRRFRCRILGHGWRAIASSRVCRTCGRMEQWVNYSEVGRWEDVA